MNNNKEYNNNFKQNKQTHTQHHIQHHTQHHIQHQPSTSFLKSVKTSEITNPSDTINENDELELVMIKYLNIKNKLNLMWKKLS